MTIDLRIVSHPFEGFFLFYIRWYIWFKSQCREICFFIRYKFSHVTSSSSSKLLFDLLFSLIILTSIRTRGFCCTNGGDVLEKSPTIKGPGSTRKYAWRRAAIYDMQRVGSGMPIDVMVQIQCIYLRFAC